VCLSRHPAVAYLVLVRWNSQKKVYNNKNWTITRRNWLAEGRALYLPAHIWSSGCFSRARDHWLGVLQRVHWTLATVWWVSLVGAVRDRTGACHYRLVLAEKSCPKRVTDGSQGLTKGMEPAKAVITRFLNDFVSLSRCNARILGRQPFDLNRG